MLGPRTTQTYKLRALSVVNNMERSINKHTVEGWALEEFTHINCERSVL